MRRPALAKLLGTLLKEGSAPLSLFSASARAALSPQFAAGILQEERIGAGTRVAVRNKAVLEAFAAQLFPSGLSVAPAGDTPRATAVGYYRDAKAAGITVAEPVLIRAFNNMVFERKGEALPAASLTGKYGVAAFLLKELPFWGCGGTLAIVENLEPFLCFEKMKVAADAAVYAGGKMSGRMLAWFTSAEMSKCSFVHCGDYDPVGIDEYLRLKEVCGARVKLHTPANIENLFEKYGKRELLIDSEAVLRRLRATKDPDALRIIEQMNVCNSGLEQEILLLG
ncbi:MAG TPA: hypothetical protein DCS63_00550 [Elusimicrobia bacterium]|nr:hypothetical protein [Elusimicrobiota bacterium]